MSHLSLLRLTVLSAAFTAALSGWSGTAAAAPDRQSVQPPPALAPRLRAGGNLSPSTSLKLSLVLEPRDPAGLQGLARSVSTPGSPDYHHYLTVSAFAARFGAAPDTIGALRARLAAEGLNVGSLAPDHLSMSASGSASRVERALSVQIRTAPLSGRSVFFNTGAASLPEGVSAVLGLDDLTRAATTLPRGAPGAAAAGSCPGPGTSGAYTPAQLAQAYGITSLYGEGLTGAGQTVAIFELADYSDQDLATYAACFGGGPADVTRVLTDGGAAIGAGTSEATADIEDLLGMAPGAHMLVYEAPDSATGIYDNYAAIMSQDRAQVVVTSWGECEPELPAGLARGENVLFQEAAVQGQTVLAAAGDSGSEDCYVPGVDSDASLTVDDPASQPYVTGVGGTSLTSVSPRQETTWNDSSGAGGGGISSIWPMPGYQRSAVGPLSSGAPCGATPGWCREVPDVSASADPAHGYWIYCNAGDCASAGWTPVGGTSLASPLWAALVALSNQACQIGPAGFLNPVLYADRGSALNDVTSGNNDYLGLYGLYAATPGYDMASGLGTPDAPTLARDLCAANTMGASSPGPGYRMVASDGGVFAFGDAGFYGSAGAVELNAPIVGMAATPDGRGYWLVASDGGVFTFGDAGFYGSASAVHLNAPIVGMAATPDGRGYWLVASDGGVFTFGDAGFYGSLGGRALPAPVVGVAVDPQTGGYWVVTKDGNVHGFGAPDLGSAASVSAPIAGMAASPDGAGYRLVGTDGSVYAMGDATDLGSLVGQPLAKPIVGIAVTPDGFGYWLVGSDGGVFTFGDASYLGSTGSVPLSRPIVGISPG